VAQSQLISLQGNGISRSGSVLAPLLRAWRGAAAFGVGGHGRECRGEHREGDVPVPGFGSRTVNVDS
jgi:hypothetical protein